MLVDTASSVNLIKEKALDSRGWINRRRIFNLIEITKEMTSALGEVKLIIRNIETPFQVVSSSFPILQKGIIGIEFLRRHNAVLNFVNDCLHLGYQDCGECLVKNDNGVAKSS